MKANIEPVQRGEVGKWYWVAHDEVFTPVYIINEDLVMIQGDEVCRREFERERLWMTEAIMPIVTQLQ